MLDLRANQSLSGIRQYLRYGSEVLGIEYWYILHLRMPLSVVRNTSPRLSIAVCPNSQRRRLSGGFCNDMSAKKTPTNYSERMLTSEYFPSCKTITIKASLAVAGQVKLTSLKCSGRIFRAFQGTLLSTWTPGRSVAVPSLWT